MKLAFGDFSGWDFHAASVASSPLGGSHSAACYLAQELARAGHEVYFFSHTTAPGLHAGVHCRAWSATPPETLRALGLEVFICILSPGQGVLLRQILGPATRLILWNQHRCDQPAIQPLRDPLERGSYDGFVFVSEWQRQEFLTHFAVPPERSTVLGNAIAPAFQSLFPPAAPILPQKAAPPLLAYTSTPFRGLDLLLAAFPALRAAVPGLRLRVFSSMQVYRVPERADQAEYGPLYERCRATPGVEYIGSLPQAALARELQAVTVFAYPNSFPETSCIALLEALASGCRVITSALGALPETAAGYARLIAVERSREEYLRAFIAASIEVLHESLRGGPTLETALRRQVEHFTTHATWSQRAAAWMAWLRTPGAARRA